MRYSLGLVFTSGASTISNIKAAVRVQTKYLKRKCKKQVSKYLPLSRAVCMWLDEILIHFMEVLVI